MEISEEMKLEADLKLFLKILKMVIKTTPPNAINNKDTTAIAIEIYNNHCIDLRHKIITHAS